MFRSYLTILAVSLLALFGGPYCAAQRHPGQAITYRDFNFVRAISCSMNYVYYATSGGIIRYDKMRQEWEQPLTSAEGMPIEPINQIWADRFDRTLVIATEFSLYEYDDFFERWHPISELPSIENDCRHVKAPDMLLPEFDANYMGRGEFADFHGRTFTTTDIVDDGAGNLWIGTHGFGPAVADGASGLIKLLPYGLIQQRVDVIAEDDSILWLAGRLGNYVRSGLTAFNPVGNRFSFIESGLQTGMPAEDIYALEVDSARLYIGTPFGLYLLNKEDQLTQGPIDSRRGLAEDAVLSLQLVDHSLFVGTIGGLNVIDLVTDSVLHVRPRTFDRQVVYDLERVDNTVWIASSAGAFRYSVETDRLQQFQDPHLILSGSVLNVELYENNLWLASDVGVVRLNLQTGKSEPFHESSGLHDQRALAAGENLVALASDYGLTIIFLGSDKPLYRTFSTDDGLASNTVLTLKLDGDYLWVGTDNGLTHFLWNNPDWTE